MICVTKIQISEAFLAKITEGRKQKVELLNLNARIDELERSIRHYSRLYDTERIDRQRLDSLLLQKKEDLSALKHRHNNGLQPTPKGAAQNGLFN